MVGRLRAFQSRTAEIHVQSPGSYTALKHALERAESDPFGKELSEGSDVTIQVRFGLVTGRRLIAWSGTALATEDQIIEEISSNPAVAKYLQKPIERGPSQNQMRKRLRND